MENVGLLGISGVFVKRAIEATARLGWKGLGSRMWTERRGVKRARRKEEIARSSSRCGGKSGYVWQNRMESGAAKGTGFPKLGCGIEGKWKAGF